MSVASGFQVARDGVCLYVRATGLANMRNAPVLDAFFQAEAEQGALTTVCVDLAQCTGMDSTFMGLLVGSAAALKARDGRLVVIHPSEICAKLLEMLGVTEVVPVLPKCPTPELEFVELTAGVTAIGHLQRMEVVRKAHQSLMGVNAANHAKFAAFMNALEADLAKLR